MNRSAVTSDTRAAERDAARGPGHRSLVVAWGWALSLLLLSLGARMSLAILHGWDNGRWVAATPWFAVAFLAEDLKLVFGFALLVAGVNHVTRRRPGFARWSNRSAALLYLALCAWIVVNVPVARFFSTPLTYSLLHATGSALGDSIAGYISLANLGLPMLLFAGGVAFAWIVRPRLVPSAGVIWASAAAALAVVAIAPIANRRVDTLGLHQNAVIALAETTLVRWRLDARPVRPALSSAACSPMATSTTDTIRAVELEGVARGRSIVWVILESTGARALRAYGGSGNIMPNIEALALEAIIVEQAYTAYPESIKGLFSVLCSREPEAGTEASDYAVGRAPCGSVADQMARAGYRTGLFHSGWFAYLGMRAVVDGRGFAVLADASTIESPLRTSFGVDDRATADRLLAFVDSLDRDQPFFALFMPIAGHHPYHAPGSGPRPFPEKDDKDAYANDLHMADDAFGLLRQGLRARGRDDRTIYVVFGDHGEAFREHDGNIAHALFLYEENVRVPLLIAAPGVFSSSRRMRGPASLIDVAPTTLALAGIPNPRPYEGRSLLATPSRIVRFSTEQAVRRVGIRDGRWKLILNEDSGAHELFDLQDDPDERRNVAAKHSALVERYLACVGR